MYPNSEDPATSPPEPRPALALAAAAAERALKLVAEGRITLETIWADREKTGFLIKAGVNPQTNKRSISCISFSEDRWGKTVEDYLFSLKSLKSSNLNTIIRAARPYSKIADDIDDDEETVIIQRPVAERSARAHIQLGYDDDDDDGDDAADHENSGAEASEHQEKRMLYTMEEEEEFEGPSDLYADDEYNDNLRPNGSDVDERDAEDFDLDADAMDVDYREAQHPSQYDSEDEYKVRIPAHFSYGLLIKCACTHIVNI